jgi:hypothetical protein
MAILVLDVIASAACVRRVVSDEEVDKMIRAQVPIGSNKQQVKTFIDNLKVDSCKVYRGDFYKPRAKPIGLWEPDSDKLDALWPRVAELVSARVFDVERSFFGSSKDILIAFAIDAEGHMIGYTVKLVTTP